MMFASVYEISAPLIIHIFHNPVLFHYRSRVRTEREERKIEGDFRRSQRACEQLDNQKVGGNMAVAQC